MIKIGDLPIAAVDRIIRRAGGNRVSESAAVELSDLLEDYAQDIAREASKLADHAGRKTVRDVDIRMAYDRLK